MHTHLETTSLEHGANTGRVKVDLMDTAVVSEGGGVKKSVMSGAQCVNCFQGMSNIGLNPHATVYFSNYLYVFFVSFSHVTVTCVRVYIYMYRVYQEE